MKLLWGCWYMVHLVEQWYPEHQMFNGNRLHSWKLFCNSLFFSLLCSLTSRNICAFGDL